MLALLADENFDEDILRAFMRRKPDADLVRARNVGLVGADDPTVLAWAAVQDRVLITHDVKTMTRFAYDRVTAGVSMPGVFEINRTLQVGAIVDDLVALVELSLDGEWEGQVNYFPLR